MQSLHPQAGGGSLLMPQVKATERDFIQQERSEKEGSSS